MPYAHCGSVVLLYNLLQAAGVSGEPGDQRRHIFTGHFWTSDLALSSLKNKIINFHGGVELYEFSNLDGQGHVNRQEWPGCMSLECH